MLISINEDDPTPIYLQIVRQIKEQIVTGELQVDDELPSVRDLGDALGISLHTARSAYQTLSDEQLLRVRLGKKARIAPIRESTASEAFDVRQDVSAEIADRMRDLVVHALLQGVSLRVLRSVLDGQIEELAARRAEARNGAEMSVKEA